MKPIITLISDYGNKDYSVPIVKALLLKLIPDVNIIDISHEISPYNIVETAFILNAIYPEFPDKTIHLIGVDAEYSTHHKHIIVSIENQIFIGADNGLFSLLRTPNKFQKIIEIQHSKSISSIFPLKDVFCEVAAKIAQNIPIENLGKPIDNVVDWIQYKPLIQKENELLAYIVYVDRFGNLITDISEEKFKQFTKNKKFEIKASSAKINKVLNKYEEFSEDKSHFTGFKSKSGMALAVFNSINLLEISLYKSDPMLGGSASELLGLKVGDSINIKINE